jgi:peptidyl-prolyl cis-trans isomerase SurA
VANGVGEVEELAFEGLEGDGHGVGGAGGHLAGEGSRIGRIRLFIALDIPVSEFVTGEDGGAFGAVDFHAFGIAGPHGGGGLNDAGGAVAVAEQGVDDVFRFDFVQRAELPHAVQVLDGPGQPAEDVDLVDGLIDECAAAFDGPAALDGTAVVFGGTKPFDVGVALEQAAEASGVDGALQEHGGVVKAMLADDAEHDSGGAGDLDHPARGGEVGGDGLLHLDMLAGFGADEEGLEAEIREGADIDVIDVGVAADFLEGGDENATMKGGKIRAAGRIDVRAGGYLKADVPVRLGVFVGNGSRSNDAYSHEVGFLWLLLKGKAHYNEDSSMTNLRAAATAAIISSCILFSGCGSSIAPDVAATVNGRPVYYTDVDRTYKSQFPGKGEGESDDQVQLRRLEVLRSLIDNEIMLQRAEKAGLVATDADVEARLSELKTPYTKEEFDKQLRNWGLTLDELKARIRKDESVKKLFNKDITSKINISDADVAAFYNANRGSFNLPEPQVHMAQIVVSPHPDPNVRNLKNDKAKTEEEASRKIKAIEARLRQGEDFAMVAQNYSEDPQTTPNGGDLGFLPESSLDKTSPELRKLVLALQPGQLSPVIHTQDGYRILKMISKEPAGQRDLSDPRAQQSIRETLLERKDQLLKTAYYEVARNEAKVVDAMARAVFAGAAGPKK